MIFCVFCDVAKLMKIYEGSLQTLFILYGVAQNKMDGSKLVGQTKGMHFFILFINCPQTAI